MDTKIVIYCDYRKKYLKGVFKRSWVDSAGEATNYFWLGPFKTVIFWREQNKNCFKIRMKKILCMTANISGLQ